MSSSSLLEISAFGSPFSHDVCSCVGEVPKYHRWIFDEKNKSEIEVYMDYGIPLVANSTAKYKYLWLCESRAVVPDVYKYVKENYKNLKNYFRKIFVHDYDLLALGEGFEYVPPAANFTWLKDRRIFKKQSLLSMVSSGKNFTEGHKFRNAIMAKQMELNPWIVFFGRNHKPFNIKEDSLADFMFSITIENESYSNYYTEKLMDCFASGTIPIYFGTPIVEKMFNRDGVITLTEDFNPQNLSPDLYESKRLAIEENFVLCMEHEKADDVLYKKIMADID
jgi:hypothetical protein